MHRLQQFQLLALATGAGLLPAQETGSTLHRLCARADAVAQVRVLQRGLVGGGETPMLQIRLKTQRGLKGQLPAQFVLREPARRACGRALHGLAVGQSLLGFFEHTPAGPRLLVTSNRGLPVVDPALLQHTRELLHRRGTAQAQLLAAALDSEHARIRRDAALSLPLHPALPGLDQSSRRQLVAALGKTLAAKEASALSLLQASRRLRLPQALEAILPTYLAGEDARLDPLLRAAIPDLGEGAALTWLSRELPRSSRRAQRRAIPLLEGCELSGADWCLRQLSEAPSRAIANQAAAALQRRSERRGNPPRRFRSILRQGSR